MQIIGNILGESNVRLVGGTVRDTLTGVKNTDVDLATPITPEHVIQLFQGAGIKVVPTGIEHGTVTVLINGIGYEITTLRRDISHDGRHAQVIFTDNWHEDAGRRDFTINAMSMDLSGHIYDYFGGKADLEAQVVRFVGNPEQRIREDYLRIFRYFRFLSYFPSPQIDSDSLKACLDLIPMSGQISAERITKELLSTLSRPYLCNTISVLLEHNLLQYYGLPTVPRDQSQKLKAYKWVPELPLVNLAAIIRCSNFTNNDIIELANKRKLSNQQKQILIHICRPQEEFDVQVPNKVHRKYIYLLGKEIYIYYLHLKNLETPATCFQQCLDYAQKWPLPVMPVTGEDLKSLGHLGKQIGTTLVRLKQIWIDNDFSLTREELINM